MIPTVGIPLCLDARGRWRAGHEYVYADLRYAGAIGRAQGLALHLPPQPDTASLLDRIDGLLIPGGDDFVPDSPYPESVIFDPVSERQLAFDRALLAGALERDLPVLGICYGMQLLALAHGGALLHDIEYERPEATLHQLSQDATHALRVEPGSKLAEIIGSNATQVNSRHHQAVADPGERLVVSATAEDGIVEAIEDPRRDFCLGVQWHPEEMSGPCGERLFERFVASARA